MLITAAMHIASHRVPCGTQTGCRQHDSDTHDSMLTMSRPTSNTVSELSEQYEGGKHTTCRTTRDQQHGNSTKAFSKPAKRKERQTESKQRAHNWHAIGKHADNMAYDSK